MDVGNPPPPASTAHRGIAVTLVGGASRPDVAEVAAMLAGAPSPRERLPEASAEAPDSALLAERLADELEREARSLRSASRIIALNGEVDPMEFALVLEHRLDDRDRERDPGATPIGLRDIVAVVSVQEIGSAFFQRITSGSVDYDSAEKLAIRIEFATMIVMIGADRVPADALQRVMALVARLNPTARILSKDRVAGRTGAVARTVPGRARWLASSMGWQLELAGRCLPVAGGIASYVFRDPRPFHPQRLHDTVVQEFGGGRVLRSRGLVRLASRADRVGSWSSAGDVLSLDPTAMLSWDPDSPAGQEIAFFGEELDVEDLASALDRCLLTPGEMLAGPTSWLSYPDPFPRWG